MIVPATGEDDITAPKTITSPIKKKATSNQNEPLVMSEKKDPISEKKPGLELDGVFELDGVDVPEVAPIAVPTFSVVDPDPLICRLFSMSPGFSQPANLPCYSLSRNNSPDSRLSLVGKPHYYS